MVLECIIDDDGWRDDAGDCYHKASEVDSVNEKNNKTHDAGNQSPLANSTFLHLHTVLSSDLSSLRRGSRRHVPRLIETT